MPETAIIILAAGASKRMGTPKQLLPWKGTTILGDVIETASKTAASERIVVLGSNFDIIQKSIQHTNVRIVQNPNWLAGMGSSITAGMAHILQQFPETEQVLITLGDTPAITFEHLNKLLKLAETSEKGIVATKYSNNTGVPAVFARKYFSILASLKGEIGAKRIISEAKEDVLYTHAEGPYIDVDTPEDYQRLLDSLA